MIALALLQAPARVIDSPLDMILGATLPTRIILTVLGAFSLISWILIIWKFRELRAVNARADDFAFALAGADRLSDADEALRGLSDSPYRRVIRQGIAFFSELRPDALAPTERDVPNGSPPSVGEGLTPTQLEALWLVLEKTLAEERDELAHGLSWLAIIGTVSPLLGLMGTVVGVMNSFIGITSQGSANIAAVAPGIAEALQTTVAGLAVAIPAVIAYNHYAARLRLFVGELEGFASEFIGGLAREGRL